jgi:hypothetical protein
VAIGLSPQGSIQPSAGVNNWRFLRHFLSDADPAYTPEEIERYVEAWSQPGVATGVINYYRSSVRTPPKRAQAAPSLARPELIRRWPHPIRAPSQ